LQIKTFGAMETQNTLCNVVLGVNTEGMWHAEIHSIEPSDFTLYNQ